MRKYVFAEKGYTFERITKKQALRAYKNGSTVLLSPVNLRPLSPYGFGYNFNRKSREPFVTDEIGIEKDFYSYIASFEYYNCRDGQTGKYAAFYIPVTGDGAYDKKYMEA